MRYAFEGESALKVPGIASLLIKRGASRTQNLRKHDSSAARSLLKRSARAARGLAKRGAWHGVFDVEMPLTYARAAAKHPIDPRKVLFVGGRVPGMPDAFSVIMPYLECNYDLDIHFISLAHGESTTAELNERLVAFARELATASVVFLDDASPYVSCVPLRPETRVVNLWHACGAFKKWGYSCADADFGRSRAQLDRRPNYANLSLVTTSSPEVNWAYEEAMGLQDRPGTVQAIGVSRTDVLFDPSFHEHAFQLLYKNVPEALGKRVLLYAPTFRGPVGAAESPDFLEIRTLRDALEGEWVLLVKHHPFVKKPPAIPADCADFAYDATGSMPIDALLVVADALVTDYSSVVFEYALTERPMCFLAPDWEQYENARGLYYPLDELCPGPLAETTADVAAFAQAVAADEFNTALVRAFRKRFMSACDGRATKRLCGQLFGEPKPHMAHRTESGAGTSPPSPGEAAAQRTPSPARSALRLTKPSIQAAKRQVKRSVNHAMLDFGLPLFYRICARKPVIENRVLFVEMSSSALSNSLQAAFDMVDHDFGYEARFVSLHAKRTSFARYQANCLYLVWLAAQSKHIFYCEGSKPIACLPLRSETSVVQLWHGCGAFKKFGMSTADKLFGDGRSELEKRPLYANADLVAISSPEVKWAYAEAMSLPADTNVIQPTGISRTDVLLDPEFANWAKRQVTSIVPQIRGKRIVLYAPTFRGKVGSAEAPDQLDIALMAEELGDTHVLLIKHHPHVRKLPAIPESCRNFAYDVTRDLPIEALMVVSDVCISDYSSLVFEYSLFGKPMAFFAYDLEEYGDWRGFYYDYDELTPGPVLKTTAELVGFIRKTKDGGSSLSGSIAAFRNRFMASCDGSSTQRLCEMALTGEIPSRTARQQTLPHTDGQVDVSIIMPTYNSLPYVKDAIESILGQSHPEERMELIVVDDCSDDGTWECACEYAGRHPNLVRCLRLNVNSGSGAAPRNRGLEEARGDYVFFLDSDDWLAPHAVRRMVRHAREWRSDVLLVKMQGEGGRNVPIKQFKGNRPNVDLATSGVLETFGPIKLFRRKLVEQHGIRFSTDFMPEDISFVLRAYTAAERISIASDAVYYYCRLHDTDTQSTFSTWNNIDSNLEALRDALRVAEKLPDDARESSLLPRLLRRDVVRMLRTMAREDEVVQQLHLASLRDLMKPHYTERTQAKLQAEARIACDLAFCEKFDVALEALPLIAESRLIDRCSYDTDDARLGYRLSLDGAAFSGDLTDMARFTCRVLDIAGDARGLEASGTLDSTIVFAALQTDAQLELIAKRDDGAEIAWPGTCTWEDAEDGEGERRIAACWKVRLDYDAFSPFVADLPRPGIARKGTTWKLFLRLSYGVWHRDVRLGTTAHPLARMAFAPCGGTFAGFSLEAANSGYGKLDLVQRALT